METVTVGPDEAERVVDELWLPLAREMAALDEYNALTDAPRADAIEFRRRKLADDATFLRIAVVDGEWVGYVQATYRPSPPVFARGDELGINELWVAPGHREQGIAGELLDRAEAWGRERGAERVGLHVNVDNEAARAMYADRGYDSRRCYLDRSL